jgi:hypothetical protein
MSKKQTKKSPLVEKFIVPPFSVFDTKQGYWQDKKKAWRELGIKSEVGRNGNLLGLSDTIFAHRNGLLKPINPVREFNSQQIFSPNSAGLQSKPGYYTKKNKGLTDEDIMKDFLENSSLAGTSIFDPVLCEIAYSWFCVNGGKIFDPFAGGSVRGIVASKLGYKYTGIDLREEQVLENRKQADEIIEWFNEKPEWIVGSSEKTSELVKDKYDLIFTCPPYYDLEVYSDDPYDLSNMDYEKFDEAYIDIIRQSIDLLNENSFSIFVVGDVRDKDGFYLDFIGKTIEAHRKAGAKLYNNNIILEAVGSAAIRCGRIFNGGRKTTKIHQNFLVFYKGDVKKIKEKFGEFKNE